MTELINLSRRSFFGGVLAVTGAAMLPGHLFAAIPTIYADGFHDDTAGLQAALDGKPFRVVGRGAYVVRDEGRIFLGQGSFRLSDTLHLRGPIPATLANFHMEWDRLPPHAPCIQVWGGGKHVLMNGYIGGPPVPNEDHILTASGWSVRPENTHTGIQFERCALLR